MFAGGALREKAKVEPEFGADIAKLAVPLKMQANSLIYHDTIVKSFEEGYKASAGDVSELTLLPFWKCNVNAQNPTHKMVLAQPAQVAIIPAQKARELASLTLLNCKFITQWKVQGTTFVPNGLVLMSTKQFLFSKGAIKIAHAA